MRNTHYRTIITPTNKTDTKIINGVFVDIHLTMFIEAIAITGRVTVEITVHRVDLDEE